ncbi:MAG: MFS transporter [Bacteroidetes bacterium]|nr:MFS transporter [Bacteroidota bacterium]
MACTFYIFGIVSTISTIVSFYLIPNVNGHIVVGKGFKSPKTLLGNVIKDKNQSNALIWTFLLIFRNSGFNPERIPLIYFIGGIFTIFASYYSGKLSDRYGSKKVYLVTVLCSFVPIILLTHLGKINIIESFFVTSLFFIFASARMIPANTLVTSSVNASTMGSFMALRSCVIELGEGLAAFIGGQIIVENPNGTFSNYTYLGYISVFLSLLTLIFAYKAKVAK